MPLSTDYSPPVGLNNSSTVGVLEEKQPTENGYFDVGKGD